MPLNQVTVKEVLDGLREFRGAALDVALAGEPRMIALLKPLVEAPSRLVGRNSPSSNWWNPLAAAALGRQD